MTPALLLGLGFGAGLVVLISGLRPAPVPLARAIAELHRRRPDPLGLAPLRRPSGTERLLSVKGLLF